MKTRTIQQNPDWTAGNYPVDYWAIFNELLSRVQYAEEHRFIDNLNLSPLYAMRDYRTIGFAGVRQSGKTRWVCDFLNRYPKSVAITTNQEFKKDMLVSHDTLGRPMPYISETDLTRVFTVKELHNYYRDTGIANARFPEVLLDADFILVDESYYVYQKIAGFGFRQLADIVNKHFDYLPIIVEVN